MNGVRLTRRGKVLAVLAALTVVKALLHYTLPPECRAAHWYSVGGYSTTPECLAIQQ